MYALNRTTLGGNVGGEPEVKSVGQNNTKVANCTMATTEKWKDRQRACKEDKQWHKCVAWGPIAKIIEAYVHKGDKLYVEGKLTTRSYQDSNNQTRYITEVVVKDLMLIDGKKPKPNQAQAPAPTQQMPEASAPLPGGLDNNEDDLPF